MIGLVGIIGCIIGIAIVGGCAVIVSAGFSIASYYDQKDAAKEQSNIQREAMQNAEARGRYQKRMNERAQLRSAMKMRAQMGSTIALDHLYAKKLKAQNARKRTDLTMAKAQTKVKTNVPRPVRNMGKPQTQLDS